MEKSKGAIASALQPVIASVFWEMAGCYSRSQVAVLAGATSAINFVIGSPGEAVVFLNYWVI